MIAITSAAALRISHWMGLSLIRRALPAPNSGCLCAIISCDELFGTSAFPTGTCCRDYNPKGR
jgi:hypothetical protein